MESWADIPVQFAADALRGRYGFDFVAVGLAAQPSGPLRWEHVSGATSQRYQRIALSPGRGVGGIVLKTGRPMLITDIDEQLDPREYSSYPIVFAEDLRSFCALPLHATFEVAGVLLCALRRAAPAQAAFGQLLEALEQGFCGFRVGLDGLREALGAEAGGMTFVLPDASSYDEDFPAYQTSDADPYKALSDRELEVFALLARGYTNREIADAVHLSVKTVEAHRAKIYAKLGIQTRAQLVHCAIRHQLLGF